MSDLKYRRLRVAGRILAAVFLGFLVLSSVGVIISIAHIRQLAILSQPWAEGFLSHTSMWLFSLILILIVSKGKLRSYGFCVGNEYRMATMIILGTFTGIALEVVLKAIPNSATSIELNYTFTQTILFVWMYASISEEVLTRGLIQSFLAPLSRYKMSFASVRISLPVLVSALFFGLMHLGLLTTGAAWPPVLCYVIFASVLGLIAGYQRERTGSIIPAIIVHIFGNIGGYCMSMLLK
jgi:membrane protease YdiL (CAAX protease family)